MTEPVSAIDPISLELFTNRFAAIADDMGAMLAHTALSTNVRERLDFSCGLLDADGTLVVNAPHIPVHLGALGLCVRRVVTALPLGPGDVAMTNHPGFGGSHLPDITVITPVFERAGDVEKPGALLGYVANRAHHAEIGGVRPGSMPPRAQSLAEEGVVIPPMLVVRRGKGCWRQVRDCLSAGPYPSRAVEENLADLRAAVAANHRGAVALETLARVHGGETVRRYMRALADHAAASVGRALAVHDGCHYQATERLDDGTPISVAIRFEGGRAAIDFTGTGGVHPGNLNAPVAVVRSAVLYVLRLLLDRPMPLNEGMLRPIDLHVPMGLLDPPFGEDPARAPAVVGGNVETSQRVVDTLIKAFGLAACSQGSMNNVLFGDATFGYYETICGGAGAGPGFHGASAVHTHMTNTRITDPEVLEVRYPVRLERFAIRRNSGGEGRWRGGDGVCREMVFEAPMPVSVLAQHRIEAPYGAAGGEAGCVGTQRLVRADGSIEVMGGWDQAEVTAGDRLIVETPGGGGWGSVADQDQERR